MLCEKCRARAATVHMSVVAGQRGEIAKHDFCESCYPEAEAEQRKSYNPPPDTAPRPTIDVEQITALEYLAANARANQNGADKPVFRSICAELEKFPKTKQRLAFEMLPMAWESLEHEVAPGLLIGFIGCWANSIEPQRLSEYVQWLEKTITRCFELAGRGPDTNADYGPFSLPLSLTLAALRKVDQNRFVAVFENLRSQCPERESDPRRKVITKIERRLSQAGPD